MGGSGHSPAAAARTPWWLACLWLGTVAGSLLAVIGLFATEPNWHRITAQLQPLSLVQTWISIAACVGLLALSRRKHAETEEAWAQGALLIYVLGGLVTAVLLHYGVLPQWLARAHAWLPRLQMLGLLLLHGGCAWLAWHSLHRYRKQA